MKIFGIELFKKKTEVEKILEEATDMAAKNKYLPDFFMGNRGWAEGLIEFSVQESVSNLQEKLAGTPKIEKKKRGRPAKKKVEEVKIQITPKGVYEMKFLDEKDGFLFNTDPKYIDDQLADFNYRKLLIKGDRYEMGNGLKEIESMVVRMQNRKLYDKHAKFYEQYPYTRTSRINALLKQHSYLKMDTVDQFVSSLPKEAIEAMKKYREETERMCQKLPTFYIIADKKDFQKTEERKDPILLAQSPFGHFWQIIGAWDEEMMLLEEL